MKRNESKAIIYIKQTDIQGSFHLNNPNTSCSVICNSLKLGLEFRKRLSNTVKRLAPVDNRNIILNF